jgi:NarL family two-component system sensor histidine kinase LiaS
VAKHGKVDQAQLSIKTQRGSLIVTIRDSGAGFEPAAYLQRLVSAASFGIFNVQQRINQLGGSFEVISAPGKGTTAYISIPLDT